MCYFSSRSSSPFKICRSKEYKKDIAFDYFNGVSFGEEQDLVKKALMGRQKKGK